MRIAILAAVSAATLTAGCSTMGAYDDYGNYGAYDYNRPDPRYGGYYADNYYRNDRRYTERRLSHGDRIYRGRNGQYYCRREDGTTGLVIGGVAGGVLGNVIAPGGSELLGTIIGAAAGAAIGNAVERGEARCR